MKTLLYYLLQVIVASGILYGYYHFALRNKKFHQYNRYYLLTATVISIIIPFLQIPFYFTQTEADSSPILKTLKTIYYSGSEDTIVVTASTSHSFFSLNILLYFLYTLVAAVLLTRTFMSLFKIKRIISANKYENLSGIRFINTKEPGTPFSFFRWIFWNKNIDLQSEKGQQIFRHEVFHIQQRHSWDIVFIEMTNTIFWINPFFHIIKKEIRAIHEFLADEFASKQEEKWKYAELLLMHALQTKQQFVNPFFHTQIKRRIAMITNSQKTSHKYLRKVLALPLITFAILLVAFTYKNKTATSHQDLTEPIKIVADAGHEHPNKEELRSDKRYNTTSSGSDTRRPNLNPLNLSDTGFNGYFSSNSIIIDGSLMKDTTNVKLRFTPSTSTTFTSLKFNNRDTSKPLDSILVIIDGKERSDIKSSTEINGIDPNDISSMTVLKGTSAIAKYGEKGKNGVVEIFTKKKNGKINEPAQLDQRLVDTTRPNSSDNKIFEKVEVEAEFPGGVNQWRKYLQVNLDASVPLRKNAPAGRYTVVVQFIVRTDGTLSDIKALTKHSYGMEDEAIRIISKGPKWIPAKQNGRNVNAYRKQPVTFEIKNTKTEVSLLDDGNSSSLNFVDPKLQEEGHKNISEIKAIAWKEGKAAYEYRGRTYIFGEIKNPDPTIAAFTEQNGTGHVFLLNGKLIESVDELNALITRDDVKKFGFISQEEMLKRFNRNDASVFIETANETITKN